MFCLLVWHGIEEVITLNWHDVLHRLKVIKFSLLWLEVHLETIWSIQVAHLESDVCAAVLSNQGLLARKACTSSKLHHYFWTEVPSNHGELDLPLFCLVWCSANMIHSIYTFFHVWSAQHGKWWSETCSLNYHDVIPGSEYICQHPPFNGAMHAVTFHLCVNHHKVFLGNYNSILSG